MYVSAGEIQEAYSDNPFAAREKYNGKYANVSGTILEIGANYDGTPYIHFIDSGQSMTDLYCEFPTNQEDAVAKLVPYQQVTVQGKIHVTNYDVDIGGCRLLIAGTVYPPGQ